MNTARLRHLRLALLPLLALLAVGCGAEDGQEDAGPLAADPGPVHVHGLGVNPRDGALFVATHTGLYRAAEGERKATRVGDRYQDTMGFTVVGPDHFLGSGHPDGRENLPPFLGLIESTDAGRTWRPVSLLGKADFHVLEAADQTVYGFGSGFETRKERLLVSQDRGRDWSGRSTPQPLIDLAIDPEDSQTGRRLQRARAAEQRQTGPRLAGALRRRRPACLAGEGAALPRRCVGPGGDEPGPR